jgi:hypothetical protein
VVNVGEGADDVQLRSVTANTSVEVHGSRGEDEIFIALTGPGAQTVIHAGPDRDTVSVRGTGLDASSTTTVHGDDPNAFPGDTLLFDPQGNSVSPPIPSQTAGTLRVDSPTSGSITYDTFEEVQIIAPPVIRFVGTPGPISEGQSVSIEIEVSPLGSLNRLTSPVTWDIDGDGVFGEVTGASLFQTSNRETLTLSWDQLIDLGINDDGNVQLGVSASNDQGTSQALVSLAIQNTPPTVPLFGAPTTELGQAYQLDFSAIDPGDDRITEWRVNWGDGSPAEVFGSGTSSAQHVFTRAGTFGIQVQPVDEDSTPNAYPPTVKNVFVAITAAQVSAGGPYSIKQGDSLTLDASAAAGLLRVAWFPNSNLVPSADGLSPTFSWSDLIAAGIQTAGTYSIVAEFVYDGGTTTATAELTVADVIPTADLINDGPVDEGDSAEVTFVDQFDPSPVDLASLIYSFDFDNDGLFEITNSNSPSAVIPASFLPDNGSYTIRGVVGQPFGDGRELFTDIVVNEVAPTITLAGSNTIQEGSLYTLGLSASDPGEDTVTQWIIDWGDGTTESSGQVASATHRFADDGPRTILVTAIDEDGSYTATKAINVLNAPPGLQELGTAVARVDENEIVQLTGRIVDPGVLDSFTLNIDWGDGTQQSVSLATGVAEFNIGHRYLDDGASPGNGTPSDQYNITVSVRDDDDGISGPSTTAVTIDNVAPQISLLQVESPTVRENLPVVVVGSFFDPGPGDIHEVTIDWGDGTVTSAVVDQDNQTFSASRPLVNDTPLELTTFNITATISDDDGGSDFATTSVQIENPPQPLEITSVTVNDGENQRSNISKIVVTFNRNTNLQDLIDSGAVANVVTLVGATGSVIPIDYVYDEDTASLTIHLPGPSSLTIQQDGFFQLRLDTTSIHADGDPANRLEDSEGTLDDVYRFDFHRLLGDFDGDREVTIADRNLFFAAYGSSENEASYDEIFDFDLDGTVDRDDYNVWRRQYRKSL